MQYIYDIKLGMLQVRESEILLRKLSRRTAQMRTLAGTLGWVTHRDANPDEQRSVEHCLV